MQGPQMVKLPWQYAVFLYATIQAVITTGVATGIATLQMTGLHWSFLGNWASAWLFAWLTMLPIVVFFAPIIRKAVFALTKSGDATSSETSRRGI